MPNDEKLMAGKRVEGGVHLADLDKSIASKMDEWLKAVDFLEVSANATVRYVERSYAAFLKALDDWHHAPLRHNYQQRQAKVLETVGATADFLGNMRMYLDHTESRCKAAEDQSYWQTFRHACVEEYDHHFAYRFCYRLRNYAQHLALPVSTINIDRENSVQLLLSSSILLRRSSKWGPIAQEIASMGEEINLSPLINQVMVSLRRIDSKLGNKLSGRTRRAIATVREMREYFETCEQAAIIVQHGQLADLAQGDPVNLEPIDFSILDVFADFQAAEPE